MTFSEISVEEAKVLLDTQAVTLVDIREPDTFAAGHIRGAVSLSPDTLETFLRHTEKSRPVICYCYFGISSRSVAAYLSEQGFEQVYSLAGGYEAASSVLPAGPD